MFVSLLGGFTGSEVTGLKTSQIFAPTIFGFPGSKSRFLDCAAEIPLADEY
jgi:hypothetical protein